MSLPCPPIRLENLKHNDTEIYLSHEWDGKPLDKTYAQGTIKMLHKITKRKIRLGTTIESRSTTLGIPTFKQQDVEIVWDGSNIKQLPQSLKYKA